MSSQQFTFPPPPPAPPQALQSYPAQSQPSQGRNDYGVKGFRGNRGYRGQGRRSSRGGSIGSFRGSDHAFSPAHGGYSVGNNRHLGPHNEGYITQPNSCYSAEYPLPNYPAVRFPQYPADLGQDYGRQSSHGPINQIGPILPPQAQYSPYVTTPQQFYGGQQAYSSDGFNSPVTVQAMAQDVQNAGSLPYKSTDSAKQLVPMGPPIRMGFHEHRQSRQPPSIQQPPTSATSSSQSGLPKGNCSPYPQNSPLSIQPNHHDPPNLFSNHRGRGQKRGHGEAFGKQRNHNPRPKAAPAVPSFGGTLLLPAKPPAPQEHARKPRKKKRKHNQLGLTPKTEEHESSEEEEDDADEESRLAAVVAKSSVGPQLLQFEYDGQLSTLQSPSDIALWIEERRKRYPTKARAAEAAKRERQRHVAQKAASQARREAQEKQRTEVIERKKQKVEEKRMGKKPKDRSEDAAVKAKLKVEKLRKQLEKEEKRAAKLEHGQLVVQSEEKAYKVNKRKRTGSDGSDIEQPVEYLKTESDQPTLAIMGDIENKSDAAVRMVNSSNGLPKQDSTIDYAQGEGQEAPNRVPDPLTPMSQPPVPEDVLEPQLRLSLLGNASDISEGPQESAPDMTNQITHDSSVSNSELSSEISSVDTDDLTSSSGSSSSDAESNGGAPDHASSRRNEPEKTLPPKREKSKNICRDYLKNGRCRRDGNCHYRHELPERGSRGTSRREDKEILGKTERVGLHQRLVEQEQEKEDHKILKAIIHLGERGLLAQEIFKPSTED